MNNIERAENSLVRSLKATATNEEFLIRSAKKAQQSEYADALGRLGAWLGAGSTPASAHWSIGRGGGDLMQRRHAGAAIVRRRVQRRPDSEFVRATVPADETDPAVARLARSSVALGRRRILPVCMSRRRYWGGVRS